MMGKRKQQGAALAVGIILLTVATLVTLAGLQGSNLQERMTSNQNAAAVSYMAAEHGASELARRLALGGGHEDGIDWEDQGEIEAFEGRIARQDGEAHFKVDLDRTDFDYDAGKIEVFMDGFSRRPDDSVASVNTIRMVVLAPVPDGVDPAFLRGLLSDQDIDINGASTFEGSVHANGNFTNSSSGSELVDRVDSEGNTIESVISASGDAVFGGGDAVSGAPTVDVPSAREWIEENKNEAHVRSCFDLRQRIEQQESDGNGVDLGGETYYCEGSEEFQAMNMTNGTIMVDGDIEMNGSSSLGESDEITVAMISSGDIRFDGQNDTYGSFWADGTVEQNGSSLLVGSIIANETIVRNGALNYRQVDDFGDVDLPEGEGDSARIASWGHYLD